MFLRLCLLVIMGYIGLVVSAPVKNNVVQVLVRPRGESTAYRKHAWPDPAAPLEIPKISEKKAAELLPESLTGKSLTEQIRSFQKTSGLAETGELDDETKLLMSSPRCEVGTSSDKMMHGGSVMKWTKRSLTYRIGNFPSGQSTEMIRRVLRQAFYEWSNVTNLDFQEVSQHDPADIWIGFGGIDHLSRTGRCSFQMDQALAHAFFPPLGEVHFNTRFYFDANWPLEMFTNTAVHEIGHTLGLSHMNSMAALMYPTAINGFTKPQPLDVQAIQQLYGARTTTDSGRNPQNAAPKFCSLRSIDATIQQSDGSIDVFAGEYFYDPISRTGRLISSKWPGLPGSIDAAFRYGTEWTFFFKGAKVWCFHGTRLVPGYPRLIGKAFPGLPDNIDAVLVDGSGKVHVFRDDRYWVYDGDSKRVIAGMPANVAQISLPTGDFDAGLNTQDQLMLFKGVEFYRWDSDGRTVRKYSNDWFVC